MKVRCLLMVVVVLFVAGALASSTHAAIDPKTVVGMWLFDDNKGTVATDSSVNKNVGTVKGTAQWVAGKFGSALQLDGKTGWVDCGDTASMAIPAGGSVTMCAWVNPTVGSVAAWQGIMAKRTASYSYGINLVKGNFQIYTSGASGIQSFAYDLPAGQWVHIATTMSKNPTQLYVNGELFGGAGKGAGGGVALAANGLGIGASGTIGEFFNGIVDDVAIFNTVLTVDDVKSLMTMGLASTFGITAVESSGKLATRWASLKSQ
jgi:hypothetical protein